MLGLWWVIEELEGNIIGLLGLIEEGALLVLEEGRLIVVGETGVLILAEVHARNSLMHLSVSRPINMNQYDSLLAT